jgi:hypothetical protein
MIEVAGRYVALAALCMVCACGRAANSPDTPGVRKAYAQPVSLGLVGYNYTNRHIDSFTVNGHGGGNLYVSSPTSGGGGTACCVAYRPGTALNTVTVRWQSGACYYHVRGTSSDEVYDTYHQFYKEAEVTVADDIPAEAKYMEVHFYPDGSVKAAVTGSASPPRILLRKAREDNSTYPRCPGDRKPERSARDDA